MTNARKTEAAIGNALRSMWQPKGGSRARTLARIAAHDRQFEAWWKFELATYLWDKRKLLWPNATSDDDIWPFVESFGRADVAIGRLSKNGRFDPVHAPENPRISIELKTTGTWWGTTDSARRKALEEAGKKRLDADLRDLAGDRRRVHPFGIVALIITHRGQHSDGAIQAYVKHARDLADRISKEEATSFRSLVNEPIALPDPGDGFKYCAHQLVWLRGGKPS